MSDDIYPAGSIPINIKSPSSTFQDLRYILFIISYLPLKVKLKIISTDPSFV